MIYLLVIILGLSAMVWSMSHPKYDTGLPLLVDMWDSGSRMSVSLGTTALVIIILVAPRFLGFLILSLNGLASVLVYMIFGFFVGAAIPVIRRIRSRGKKTVEVAS